MSLRTDRISPGLSPNLTPLVDVVFLLIVFFIVVAQITTNERLELTLPNLVDAQTVEPTDQRRVIINVAPQSEVASVGGVYLLSGETFPDDNEGIAALTDRLSVIHARNPAIAVSIRADRMEQYQRVHEAMRACAQAGVRRVNLIAQRDETIR